MIILVIEDHDLVRLGLKALLQSHTGAARAPPHLLEARTLQEGLAVYERWPNVNLVLLDLHLPDSHGVSGLTRFLHHHPRARVVVLSAVTDRATVAEAMARGATGYLPKSGDLGQVLAYCDMGQAAPPPMSTANRADSRVEDGWRAATGDAVALSVRQRQVLERVLGGQPNKAIASDMALCEGTVKNHVSTLLLIFGVRSRAQLITLLR